MATVKSYRVERENTNPNEACTNLKWVEKWKKMITGKENVLG